MGRKRLIRTHQFPYHVTTRTNNKEWFDIPMNEVWRMCLHSLTHANSVYKVEVISFVLMSNHYHMILRTPDANIDLFMYEFNKRLALMIRTRSNRINQVFGGRYRWSIIRSKQYLYNCYRYVYQNPLRATIVTKCENYPYSTLHYLIHKKHFPVSLVDTFGFKDEFALSWINERINACEEDAIRRSFKRSQVTILKVRNTRRKIDSY